MTKPLPPGSVVVTTPTIPGTKDPMYEGAGYAPVYIPYPTGGAWTAPGYSTVQPAWGGPRVVVSPEGDVLVEVMEAPPLTPAPLPQQSAPEGEQKSGGALLFAAALAALLFA